MVRVCLKDRGRERGTGVSKRQEGGSVVQVCLKERREGAWYRCV